MIPFSEKKETKIPFSQKLYLLILMSVGADCGFSEHFGGNIKIIARYYSTMISLIIITILIGTFPVYGTEVWFWLNLFEGIITFGILQKTTYKLYAYMKEFQRMAKGVPKFESEVFGIAVCVYTFGFALIKIALDVYRCEINRETYCNFSYGNAVNTVYAVATNIVDSVPTIQLLIIYYVYGYIHCLKESLKKGFNIDILQDSYIALADTFNKIRPLYDQLILLGLIVRVPKLLATVWLMLVYIESNATWFAYFSEFIFALYLETLFVFPAILVQKVKNQSDDIKDILNERWMQLQTHHRHNGLLHPVDGYADLKSTITDLLKYMKRRRLNHEVWGVFPTDLRLPLTLVSVCVTYLIVVVQFTHLYD